MRDFFKYYLNESKEKLIKISLVKQLYILICITLSYLLLIIDKHYHACWWNCRCLRISGIENVPFYARLLNKKYLDMCISTGQRNLILDSFINTAEAINIRNEYKNYGIDYQVRLKIPIKEDWAGRQGDLLILKNYNDNTKEKGVLFIQYTESIGRFAAIYNLYNLAKYYRFVFEPSWWGYYDVLFYLYIGLKTDVIIESQYEPDFKLLNELNCNLKPIRLGFGDWVNPFLFKSGKNEFKKYDAVMIANWQRFKRHKLLFKAISKIKEKIRKIALIGVPFAGRTIEDIKREAQEFNICELIDFFERIPSNRVGEILRQSKACVLLSKREGANRGIYEAMFSDVPVLILDENKGVNKNHINDYTGIISNQRTLSNDLLNLIENYNAYSPREWALKNTGYINSNKILNEFIKDIAKNNGEPWETELFAKSNSPNACYVKDEDLKEAEKSFEGLQAFLRK